MATFVSTFNERLYEFCVNFELVTQAGALIAGYAPGIPSPQDEADLGWDAKVPMPSFGVTFLLQYKVSRLTTARAGANAKFWDIYQDDYYRFGLHRDKTGAYRQHELLLNEAATGAQALYCAPLMTSRGELVNAMRHGEVIAQSALIPVAALGAATPGIPHSVTYPADDTSGSPTLHSNPRRGERLSWVDLQQESRRRREPLTDETFERISTAVLEQRPRRRRRERSIAAPDSRAGTFLRASSIVLDEIGATLVVLPADSVEG